MILTVSKAFDKSTQTPTFFHKNNETDKFHRKVASFMYTEMVNIRPQR